MANIFTTVQKFLFISCLLNENSCLSVIENHCVDFSTAAHVTLALHLGV